MRRFSLLFLLAVSTLLLTLLVLCSQVNLQSRISNSDSHHKESCSILSSIYIHFNLTAQEGNKTRLRKMKRC